MKVLILGARGNLGGQLVKVFSDLKYEVTAWSRAEVDITDKELINKKIDDIKPDLIINAAAYNNVDECEKEEEFEKVSPHAFPLVLKDSKYGRDELYTYLESKGIQCKNLFGSLPTQHQVFKFLNYEFGQFPISEYVGENGLHFGIHQYLDDDDLVYISDALKSYFKREG